MATRVEAVTQILRELGRDDGSTANVLGVSRKTVAEACGDDVALRAEVESLLAEADAPFPMTDLLPGAADMGSVYEAQQEQPRRTVALKVMRWSTFPRRSRSPICRSPEPRLAPAPGVAGRKPPRPRLRHLVENTRGKAGKLLHRAGDNGYEIAGIRGVLGWCLLKMARYKDAQDELTAAVQRLQQQQGPPRHVRPVIESLVTLYEAWGKPEQVAKGRAKLP